MFPVLDEPIIDIGRRHVPAIYVMQDLGSLIGLAAVLAMVCYALRRGQEPPVPNRLVSRAERIEWILAYTVAAIAFSVAVYLWARWGRQPALRSIVGRVSSVAIASLRGLTAALFGVSFVLQLRLRALRHRSSGPER
jgi:formate hydrogenlyase subunit 3/multisubunit Na+/H+ antiporter MnhD subunit